MQNENTTTESIQSEVISPEIVYQQDKAMVDIQIATAKQYPRNITKALENATAIATLDDETAKTCGYSVPRGKGFITGPSVHLARIMLQTWGNLRAEAKVINIDHKHVTSQATAFDLESNVAIKVEVKRSIIGKYGRFNDDMITVTGNAANAIALRNAIFGVIPRNIVDKVYNASTKKLTGDLSDEQKLQASRLKTIQHFRDHYNLTEKQVLRAVNKEAIHHLTKEDILVLVGIDQAIKDGDTTINEAFKIEEEKKESKENKTVDAVKQGMAKVRKVS